MIHDHDHDTVLVALSAAVAVLGSYTTLDLFRRVRANPGWARAWWLAATATAMGLTIWSMHFVAMLAYQPGIPVLYDLELVLASLLAAVAVSAVAFLAAVHSGRRPVSTIAGGLFTGLAICAMHYIAIAGMRAPAKLVYDPTFVILSIVIALGVSTAAFALALGEWRRHRLQEAAVTLGLAICAMHYVAMLGLGFAPPPEDQGPIMGIGSRSLAFAVVAGTLAILALGQTAAWFDRLSGTREVRFRSLVTNMRGIVFRRLDASPHRPGGTAMAQLYGLDAGRIAGVADPAGRLDMAGWCDAIHPDDRSVYLAAARAYRERHEPFALHYRILDPGTGEARWIEEVAWVTQEPATGRVWLDGCLIDRTEQKQAEAALRESEQRHLRLVEAAPVAILTFADWRCTYANPRAVRLLRGKDAPGLLGRLITDFVDEETFAAVRRDLAATDGGRSDAPTWELSCRRCDGTRFPAEASAVTILQRRQAATELVLVDLTERKRAESAQALLIDELSHRVKNILATIDAMVAFSAAEAGTAEELSTALSGRIAAMSRTHDLLTGGGWEGANLADIVGQEMQPYAVADQVSVDGDRQLLLTPKAALSLSLVLHELTTNALKHGALSVPDGRIAASWAIEQPAGGESWLVLTWQESGGPLIAPPLHRGFGTTLIERAAAQDLGGEAKLRFAPPGLRCELRCPLARVMARCLPPGEATPTALALEPAAAGGLEGARILIVEDEMLLTLAIEATLHQAGAEPVGPVGTLPEALALARGERLDAAVLDVDIADEPVFPVADILLQRGVPFVFATGYVGDAAIPPRYRGIPRLPKPYRRERLQQALAQLVAGRRHAAAG
jgi:PAS domain S-box-containing protein